MTKEDLTKLEYGSKLLKRIEESEESIRAINQFIENSDVKEIDIKVIKSKENKGYLLRIRHDKGIGADIIVHELNMPFLKVDLTYFLNDYIKELQKAFDKL
jgi:hypothetical protein